MCASSWQRSGRRRRQRLRSSSSDLVEPAARVCLSAAALVPWAVELRRRQLGACDPSCDSPVTPAASAFTHGAQRWRREGAAQQQALMASRPEVAACVTWVAANKTLQVLAAQPGLCHSALRPAAAARSTFRHRLGTTLIPAAASFCSNSGWLRQEGGGAAGGACGACLAAAPQPTCSGRAGRAQAQLAYALPARQQARAAAPDAALQPHTVGLQRKDVVKVLQGRGGRAEGAGRHGRKQLRAGAAWPRRCGPPAPGLPLLGCCRRRAAAAADGLVASWGGAPA